MTQSQVLNANFDWLQAGKKEFFPEYKIDDQKTVFDRIAKAKRSTFDRSKFTVVGSPSITEDGIASGISNQNYVQQPINLPVTQDFKIEFEWTVDGSWTSNTSSYVMQTSPGYMGIYDTIVYNNVAFDLYVNIDGTNTNKQVVFSIPRTKRAIAGTYKAFYQKVGLQYFVGLKTPWDDDYVIKENTEARGYELAGTANVTLLRFADTLNRDYDLSYDLKKIRVESNGVEVFNGNKTGVDQIKKDDYTVVGTPTITDDGIASGFSNGNYIKRTNLPMLNTPFKFEFSFYTGNDVTTQQAIVGYDTTYYNYVTIDNKRLKVFLNLVDGTNTSLESSIEILPNTKYTGIFEFTGSAYKLCINDETPIIHLSSSLLSNNNNTNCTFGNIGLVNGTVFTRPFLGSIDLNSLKIYFDNNLVYQPTLRIPYTQSKTGEKIVDAVYRDRVQDMYKQFGYTHYYTLGDEPEKYNVRVVGSPTLVGGVASGFSGSNYLTSQISIPANASIVCEGSFKLNDGIAHQRIFRTDSFGLEWNGSYLVAIRYFTDNTSDNCATSLGNVDLTKQTYFTITASSSSCILKFWNTQDNVRTITRSTENTLKSSSLLYFGRWENDLFPINGSIDLSKFSIEVDGKEVLRGYEPAIVDAYTLQTVPNEKIVDSYYADNSFMELTADLALTQAGGAVSGQTVNLKRPYKDNKYIATIGTSSKDTNSFVASASGQWITKGKGVLG